MQVAGAVGAALPLQRMWSPPDAGSTDHGIALAAAMIAAGVASPFRFSVATSKPVTPWNMNTPVCRVLSTSDAPNLSSTA